MFLHIGNNVLLRKDEVIGIFSIDSLQNDNKGKKFLVEVKEKLDVEDISNGKHSSLVLTDSKAFISRISSATLLQRSGNSIYETLREISIVTVPKKNTKDKR